MNAPSPLLRLEAVTVARGYRRLIEHFSLQIAAGEICQLAGPNGCGKTTLLECIAGLRYPEAGRVVGPPAAERLWLGHRSGLSTELTAVQNLVAYCRLQELPTDGVAEALQGWGLPLSNRPLGSFSAGQQQRAALATLDLHRRARLWLLDEPAAALDAAALPRLAEAVRRFTAGGGAVLFTTHQGIADLRARRIDLAAAKRAP